MDSAKILTITKGEEFKLTLREKIDEKDIFYEQYLNAADMLNDIVSVAERKKQEEWSKVETENNIIAFCGERGEGKSSAMMTFINAVTDPESRKWCPIFRNCEYVKSTIFSKPVVIDPSTFDNVHNILEIIVSSMFRKFQEEYEKDNGRFDDSKREKLLDNFQKVYRIISLINNPKKMLEEEFDGEANIANLSRMGESTELKRELKSLIKIYLDTLIGGEQPKKLLLAIDDLDLCNANAYKMAEQMRKYLIIPDVVIVMALKVEQLQMCIQEENFKNYSNLLHGDYKSSEFYEEVRNMAEKYITKLIPRSRRIYLPNVQYMLNTQICYLDNEQNIIYQDQISNSLNVSLLHLIYRKTGMKFFLNIDGTSWLQSDNLRDMVNMITLLANMSDPTEDKEYYNNIEAFSKYIEKEWIPQNYDSKVVKELQSLFKLQYFQMNSQTIYLLSDMYEKTQKKYNVQLANYNMEHTNSFFWIRKWLDVYKQNVYARDAEKYAYIFHVIYTIRLNEARRNRKYYDLSIFLGGYVWGEDFNIMLPNARIDKNLINRSRFGLAISKVYNVVASQINQEFEVMNEELNDNNNYISKIPENDLNREYKILTWMISGLLSNTFRNEKREQTSPYILTFETDSIIHSNYTLINAVHICIENYIVGLCNLGYIYDKVKMEMLGISWGEYEKIVLNIEKNNITKIEAFRTIFTDIDLIGAFWNWCYQNKETKDGGEKDERGRTVAAVDRFFRNAENFLQEYVDINLQGRLNELIIENLDGKQYIVNISNLYADLFVEYERTINRMDQEDEHDSKKILLNEWKNELETPIIVGDKEKKVSTYLKNKSSQNAKKNLENLAYNINIYCENNSITKFDIEKLENYYSRILDIYIKNPQEELSKPLSDEYRQLVELYNRQIKE
ncbi:hypothetical protein NE634_11065 [Lacrimispora saccharolytica]|nr:hypothetical protein [Lacrimispora saccharolytica]